MKWPNAHTLLVVFCLGLTIFFCHVTCRLRDFCVYSLDGGQEGRQGPEPLPFKQLLLCAAHFAPLPFSGNACINNLRHMDGAKQQWALEHPNSFNKHTQLNWKDIGPYLNVGPSGKVWCPNGGRYAIGQIADAPTCSIKNHKLP